MKFIIVLVIVIIYSCNSHKNQPNRCIYKVEDMLKVYDTTKVNVWNNTADTMTEITDKSNMIEKGIYKFDENNVLRFYAFLVNDKNEFDFSKEYDSNGNLIGETGNDVIQWRIRKIEKDSFKATFLLYALGQAYKNVSVRYANQKVDIELGKFDNFSNLIGGSVDLKYLNQKSDTIYLVGLKENTCTHISKEFKDFGIVPSI